MASPVLPQEPLVGSGCLLWSRLGGEEGAGPVPWRPNICWVVGG